jgi:hypothetical protein
MALIEECGHRCAGRSVPGHVHEPLTDESHHAPARDRVMADPGAESALQLLVRRVTQPRRTPDA